MKIESINKMKIELTSEEAWELFNKVLDFGIDSETKSEFLGEFRNTFFKKLQELE